MLNKGAADKSPTGDGEAETDTEAGPDLDRVLQALSDGNRRLMVERLTRGPASVSELSEPFAMSLSAVMQHLSVLETAGVVRTAKTGRVRTCHLEPAALRAAESWLHGRRTDWERRLETLDRILAEAPTAETAAGTHTAGTPVTGAPKPGTPSEEDEQR
ncbi:helix-turn-helix transcriptional regulator [Streptomyces sp. SM14]|uniref:ArsR/SmtB family transcription factor n=1 Tax=Streptomyces sp. SM14 TaxID=1736045 RepID=UPI000CD5AA7B|nr:metalloregulator ArsR/SmtB family transcription factor [Streptomyces sp. SM14]